MGKIRKEWDSEFKQWVTFDEDDVVDGTPELGIKMIKSGALGREAQYRYFSEHPDEIEDQKLFSELEKEFGDDIEYVDLGLSVKWATCNLGATSPEETGHRYTFDEKSELVDVKIPTREQWKELIDNCTWEWKNKGVVITGKNGNSIFLPAVGELNTDGLFEVGNAGSYWGTTMSSDDRYSYYMSFIRKRSLFDWKYKLTKGIYSTFNSARTLVIRSVQ